MGRHDVEGRHAGDALGPVERHAEGDARAAVMPGDGEALEAERRHDLEVVLAHGAEGVAGSARAPASTESP